MRVFSARLQQLLGAGQIRLQAFARLYLASGLVGASDADDSFSWDNGLTGPVEFVGFGQAFAVTVPPSTSVIDAGSTTGALQLSGTDPGALSVFLGESYRARQCDAGLLFFDLATGQPVEELIAFRGLMDTASVNEDAADPLDLSKITTSTLTLTLQPRTVDIGRKGTRTRSDADQRLYRDAADSFFQDVGLVAQTQINWDRGGPSSPAAILGAGATKG